MGEVRNQVPGQDGRGAADDALVKQCCRKSNRQNQRLCDVLRGSRAERTLDQVEWMRSLIEKYECDSYARRIAQELAGAALHEFGLLSTGLPDSRDKSFLEQMATWVIERT